jgi:large exoprotein involved in heme utilization and adhesion
VQINTPDIDSAQRLIELPASVVDTPKLISSSCSAFADSFGSKFIVTGRGGLPQGPDKPLTSDVVWSDTRLPVTTAHHQHKRHAAKPKPKPIAIVPAVGWVLNNNGVVTLISSATNTTSLNTPTSCLAK